MSKIIVNGKEYCGGGSGGNYYLNTIYSTEEKKVGYWTDNKPLYQKSFVIDTSNLNTGWNDISSGLSGIDCKDITGKFRFPANDNSIYEFPYAEDSNYCLFGGYKPSNDTIFVYKGQGFATISDFVVTLRYTKTTDTPELNPQTGGVIYLPSIYSDEEREIGVWRDGKPLYQKTYEITNIPSQSLVNVPHGIVNLDRAQDIRGICYVRLDVDANYSTTPLPRVQDSNTTNNIAVDVTRTNIVLKARGDTLADVFDKIIVTIQYTKTTDVAGSGTWNGQGGIAHHYSTNETVIGTWADGKPLYEKTFNVNTSIAQNTTYVVGDITGLDIVNVSGIALTSSTSGFNIPYYNSTSEQAQLWWGSNELKFYQEGYTITGLKITIQYTKTTDT